MYYYDEEGHRVFEMYAFEHTFLRGFLAVLTFPILKQRIQPLVMFDFVDDTQAASCCLVSLRLKRRAQTHSEGTSSGCTPIQRCAAPSHGVICLCQSGRPTSGRDHPLHRRDPWLGPVH